MTLYPKRTSAICVGLGCVAGAATGIWMVSRGEWFGYVCAGFGGLAALAAVVQLMPGSSFLRLDPDGITCASLFRKTVIPWSAVDRFYVVTMRQTGLKVHEMVGFDFVPSYDRARLWRGVSRAIAGCEGALPDTYGMKAVDLASMLTSRLQTFNLDFHRAREERRQCEVKAANERA